LAKKRRNDGPQDVKIIVTNRTEASTEAILSMYEWHWGVEITIKALKSGLPLGQMQVTNDKEWVTRSVALAVLASFLWSQLYGKEETATKV
jgi:transposase